MTPARIGIVGGGVMGAGIALVAARFGSSVTIAEADEQRTAAAVETVQRAATREVEKGRLSQESAAALRVDTGLAALADADVVIEAATESEEIKQQIFAELESHCRADAIFATNTSSLSLTAIGSELRHPNRFAGMHFFNPATRMRLVEIISTPHTATATADRLAQLARDWQKVPVRAKDAPGFIVNRLARPFYGEALLILETRRAEPVYIDAALRAAGFPMGAFELMDLIGNDVNYAVTESVWRRFDRDPRFTPSPLQREKIDAGLLGRKSGGGFYRYDNGKASIPPPSPPAQPPSRITLHGEHAGLEKLAAHAGHAGITVFRGAGTIGIEIDSIRLTPVEADDGSAAAVIDYIADYENADLFTVYCRQCSSPQRRAITDFFAACGKASLLVDSPAMISLRTIAMIVNLAVAAHADGLASREDIDLALRAGLNHPRGPFEWLEVLKADRIAAALQALRQNEDTAGRYETHPDLMGEYHHA